MLVGCGVDIEEHVRFQKYFERHNQDTFFKLVYTQREIVVNQQNPQHFYPLGFTCKEAVFKALGISWTNSPIDWKQVELLFNTDNSKQKPELVIGGYAAHILNERNISTIEFDYQSNKQFALFEVYLYK